MDHIKKFVANIGLNRNQTDGTSNKPSGTPTQHQDGLAPVSHEGKSKVSGSADNRTFVNNSNRASRTDSSGVRHFFRFINRDQQPKAQPPKFKDTFFALSNDDETRDSVVNAAHVCLRKDFFDDSAGNEKSRDLWENDDRFQSCLEQYTTMADRISDFAKANREEVSPALSDNSIENINKNFQDFKNHLTNLNEDYYSIHKADIYGDSKALMHTFEHLLSDNRIPMQTRLDAIKNLAEKSTVCVGGFHTELTDVVVRLQSSSKGLEGALFRAKSRYIDALILAHVAENHHDHPGNDVHYGNAYFNHIASDFGLSKRDDPLVKDKETKEEQRTALGIKIKSELDPLHLISNIAEEYLGRVHQCLADAGLDSHQPLSGDDLDKACKKLGDDQSLIWDGMFGEVPITTYFKPTDDMCTAYQVAKSPMAITLQMMDKLKEKGFIDFTHLTFAKENDEDIEINMTGNLLWMQDGDARDAVEIRQLFDKKTETILKAIENNVPKSQQGMFQKQLVQIAVDHADPAKSDSLPDAGLSEMLKATLNSSMKIKTEEQRKWLGSVVACVAACNGVQTLDALIKKGAPIENGDSEKKGYVEIYANGKEPMMYALENGHLNIARKLCEAGVSLKKMGFLEHSYQYYAASGGQVESLLWLEQQGLELNPTVWRNGASLGSTMSYWLAKSGNVKALGTLQDVGVNVMNAEHGDDALSAAFESANLDTISFLIDRRMVDIHAPSGADGRTTAVYAATFNSDEIQCNIFPHLVAKDPTTFEKVYDYLNRERQDTREDGIIKYNLRRVVNLLPAGERIAANEMIARWQET